MGCVNEGKTTKFYDPELGQGAFGNPSGELDFDSMPNAHVVEHMLLTISHYATGDAHDPEGFSNRAFELRPYYWGDCTCGYERREWEWDNTHHHAPDCYQTEYKMIPKRGDKLAVRRLCEKHSIPWNGGVGSAVHCTCEHDKMWRVWQEQNDHAPDCPTVLPNFRHKASGLEIRWYKHIGRGMSVNTHVCDKCFLPIFKECLDSLLAAGEG